MDGVRSLWIDEWRRRRDSNPRYRIYQYDGLANRWFQPLTHVSAWQHIDACLPQLRGRSIGQSAL